MWPGFSVLHWTKVCVCWGRMCHRLATTANELSGQNQIKCRICCSPGLLSSTLCLEQQVDCPAFCVFVLCRFFTSPADQHGCDSHSGEAARRPFPQHSLDRNVSNCLWEFGWAWWVQLNTYLSKPLQNGEQYHQRLTYLDFFIFIYCKFFSLSVCRISSPWSE